MSEQARKVKKRIPEWAEGLYYNSGLISEVLVYHDDEAIYFECRGKDSGIVRFSFEMLETLETVIRRGVRKLDGLACGTKSRERRLGEVRRIFLPRTSVNKPSGRMPRIAF